MQESNIETSTEELLRVEHLFFSYRSGGRTSPILKDVSLVIRRGEFVGIQGRSGSGKSTLFHILGCLLKPDKGSAFFNGTDLTRLSSDEAAYVRNSQIGFIFQQFHLLSRATVLENILLPTNYPCEVRRTVSVDRAIKLAEAVGLSHRLQNRPNELSGGEQQRVVIARALMSDADLILADEPTGNLDTGNAEKIMELLKALNREGKTIVLITHDSEVAKQCGKVYHLKDGQFLDVEPPSVSPAPKVISQKILRPQWLTPWMTYTRMFATVLPLAIGNLKRNKVRALLTMVGVTVGIASVFAMLTFGEFAKSKILEGYEEMGVNTVIIRGYPNWQRKATDPIRVLYRSMNWQKDAVPLFRIFPTIQRISPLLTAWSNISFGGPRSPTMSPRWESTRTICQSVSGL